jgi:Endoribonuclease L-PSP
MNRSPVVLIMVGVVRPQQPARRRPAAQRFALAPDTVTAVGTVLPVCGQARPPWGRNPRRLALSAAAAGSSLENVLKCTVYCTSVDKFAAVNTIYARYFPAGPPARVFLCVPAWPGTFDIEVDCVATI